MIVFTRILPYYHKNDNRLNIDRTFIELNVTWYNRNILIILNNDGKYIYKTINTSLEIYLLSVNYICTYTISSEELKNKILSNYLFYRFMNIKFDTNIT